MRWGGLRRTGDVLLARRVLDRLLAALGLGLPGPHGVPARPDERRRHDRKSAPGVRDRQTNRPAGAHDAQLSNARSEGREGGEHARCAGVVRQDVDGCGGREELEVVEAGGEGRGDLEGVEREGDGEEADRVVDCATRRISRSSSASLASRRGLQSKSRGSSDSPVAGCKGCPQERTLPMPTSATGRAAASALLARSREEDMVRGWMWGS